MTINTQYEEPKLTYQKGRKLGVFDQKFVGNRFIVVVFIYIKYETKSSNNDQMMSFPFIKLSWYHDHIPLLSSKT